MLVDVRGVFVMLTDNPNVGHHVGIELRFGPVCHAEGIQKKDYDSSHGFCWLVQAEKSLWEEENDRRRLAI